MSGGGLPGGGGSRGAARGLMRSRSEQEQHRASAALSAGAAGAGPSMCSMNGSQREVSHPPMVPEVSRSWSRRRRWSRGYRGWRRRGGWRCRSHWGRSRWGRRDRSRRSRSRRRGWCDGAWWWGGRSRRPGRTPARVTPQVNRMPPHMHILTT